MTSNYQTQQKEIKHNSLINDFANKRIRNSNILSKPRKTYNYESNIIDILNDNIMNHCISEDNNNQVSNKAPSIASLSEEDNYNIYAKKIYDTNPNNSMKKITNNQIMYPESGLYSDILLNLNSNLNLNKPKINYLDYKLAQLNSELAALNSDNIMLKEDIYKYTDINKYLESEIKIQKEHNKDLLNTNERLIEENNDLNDKLVNDSNLFNELIQENEANQKEYDEKQKNLELKNIKVNTDYEELININNKTKNDYNILYKNFDELNIRNNDTKNEICLLKELQNKHFIDFEEKMKNIISEIDVLKKEQNALNKENNENKKKLDIIQKDKEDYYNKYNEQLLLNEKLNKELYNSKINMDMIRKKYLEKNEKELKRPRKRRTSLVKKQELIKELQKKIDDYKVKSLRYSYMDDY